MDFIVDNYLWFIVGIIVILMIIIGFIAEKTDFGRKPFNHNKKEKIEEDKKTEVSNEIVPIESNKDEVVIDSQFELPMEDVQIEDNLIPETEEIPNDLEMPIDEVLPENIDDQLVEDLEVPELSNIEEPVGEDSVVAEVDVAEESEDDVWKF